MRHYSLEKWVDFARNVIGEDEKMEMQSHLQTGCTTCSKEFGMWQRLQQVARRESGYSPSAVVVRMVNASFANRFGGQLHHAKAEVASLLFDSFRSPLLAGVRSAESASQQLLYGAGDYRIDIRIEPQIDSEKVVLIGQVLNAADPDERLSALPVNLLKGRKILAESVTTQFGEFQIECGLEECFRLAVLLPGGREVSLQLVEPVFIQAESSAQIDENNRIRKTSRIKKKGTRTKD
ncbi:MAG TPA: hypothetical protein VIH88_07650 [Candidatus Acidoferrales bacterium]